MMRLPALTDIRAAELKVELGARRTLDDLAKARAAMRAMLERPATLALVAGASGLLGFWVARRRTSAPSSGRAHKVNPVAGLLLTFLVQIAMRNLPLIFERVSTARTKRAAQSVTETGAGDSPGGRPL